MWILVFPVQGEVPREHGGQQGGEGTAGGGARLLLLLLFFKPATQLYQARRTLRLKRPMITDGTF
jgi:hypothetical protein